MKKIIILLLLLIGSMPFIKASEGCLQNLSPEEFRQKQQAFITKEAGLTDEEAQNFFPLYFELQDKKKELNDKIWRLLHKGKDNKLSEAEYEEIILGVYDLRIESNELEKTYYAKFKQVLSAKKIYLVQRGENKFHRDLVRSAGQGRGGNPERSGNTRGRK